MFTIAKLPHRGVSLCGEIEGWLADAAVADAAFNRFAPRGFQPPLDIVQTAEGYEISVELPGFSKEELSVHIADDMLTIEAAARAATTPQAGRQVLTSERRIGKQYRALRLAEAVDEKNIHAAYQHGVLKLTIPRAPQAEAKRIQLTVH